MCNRVFDTNRSIAKKQIERSTACNPALCFVAVLTSILAIGCCEPLLPPVVETPQIEEAPAAPSLIPRSVLFGNPDRAATRLSPDGKSLSFLAPVDGVLNVWVGPTDDLAAAKPVTTDTERGVRIYFWAYTNQHVIYLQDKEGNENWHVYLVDLKSGETKNLTPLENVRAQIEGVSHKFPEEILIGLNDRDPRLHDIHRLNIKTGERTLVMENPGFAGFLTDDDYNIRFGTRMTPDGGSELMKPPSVTASLDNGAYAKDDKKKKKGKKKKDKKKKKSKSDVEASSDESENSEPPIDPFAAWESFIKISMEDSLTTAPIGFDKSGRILYMLDSRERNTAAFATLNLDTNELKMIADDPRADLQGAMVHPTEYTVEAVAFTFDRKLWKILDEKIAPDFEALGKVADGDFEVISRTLDDTQWIVAYIVDDGPVRYYRYVRESKQAHFLFTNRSQLEGLPLVEMRPEMIQSRDGLNLVNYLSLPAGSDQDGDGRPDKPLPMVLSVHGGPWGRVNWGYNSHHQWFANRGYAVLDVNFRGSTGFGKEFINAGNMEWAGKMHDDLIDAVDWAIEQKIADPERVAIFGGSYGGYATLVGLTFTPETFACGVDIVGPSNLVTLLNTIPPYWAPMIELFTKRVGDHRTEDGVKLLTERSPLTYADQIVHPLLIAQGANDPRVKQAESDQIVKAMQDKNIPVTYILYSDEGHGFARPENRMSFYAVSEAFLSKCLGGHADPVGEDFQNSTIAAPAGAEHVPGLQESLSK
jgi:dipeptidyl aminopeptidase/acylaminoacyl peptidase